MLRDSFFPFIRVAVSEDEDSKQLILPVVHVAFTRFRLKSVVFCFDIFVLFIVYICEKGSKAMLSGFAKKKQCFQEANMSASPSTDLVIKGRILSFHPKEKGRENSIQCLQKGSMPKHCHCEVQPKKVRPRVFTPELKSGAQGAQPSLSNPAMSSPLANHHHHCHRHL